MRPPAVRAAVFAPVFLTEAACFGSRAKHLRPLPVLEHAHVAARKDLKRALHPLRVVELRRAGFPERLEPRRIHEVAHRDAVDRELDLLHRVRGLVRVERIAGARGRQVDRRVDEHFRQLVARSYAHLLPHVDGALHEHLRERQTVGGEVVVAERIRDVRAVQKRERPGALPESGRLKESGRRAPHRDEVLVHELLERGDEPGEVHAQRRGGLVEAGDRGHLSVVERGGDEARACGLHDVSFKLARDDSSMRQRD